MTKTSAAKFSGKTGFTHFDYSGANRQKTEDVVFKYLLIEAAFSEAGAAV